MWKQWQLYCVLLCLCARTSCQRTALDAPIIVTFLRIFRNWSFNAFGRTGTEERYLQLARDASKVQEVIPDDVPFPCNVTGGRSAEVPDSVHKLRPGDIDVIAAMGDSLTAGAGAFASNILQVIVENRGISATGGGQGTWRQYLTLPNIIKEFNPSLIGYALGDSLASNEASQLNVAESGAFSEDMPYMAETLVTRIKRHPKVDMQKHWKFISISIGGNDFCTDICWIPSPWSVLEKHKAKMLQVLRTLRDNLPRTFVALIPPPHLKALIDTNEARSSLRCYFTRNFECSCMFGLAFERLRPMYYDIMRRAEVWIVAGSACDHAANSANEWRGWLVNLSSCDAGDPANEWQELDLEIAASPEFQRNDFAVVGQPILVNLSIPLAPDGYTDMTYLSVDCFHISQKTNARFANSLWNSLFQPVGAKATNLYNLFEEFYCPTPDKPYLATTLNSKR